MSGQVVTEGLLEPARSAAAGDDAVLPFQLDALDVRGRVARLDGVLDHILSRHDYPPSICALIGEAALLTAMIGQALSVRGRFSLQARGDGPASLIASDYFPPETDGAPARLRAYAHFDRDRTPAVTAEPEALMGDGVFALTLDQGRHMRPYQGLTPLGRSGLSAAATTYFAQSEQLATQFKTTTGLLSAPGGPPTWRAGGVMIQHLAEPGEHVRGDGPASEPTGEDGLLSAQDVADMSANPDDWRRASLLLDTAEELELIGPRVSPEELLYRLFHEVGARVYPSQLVDFGCTCGREKVAAVLRQYSEASLREMTTDDGDVSVDCQFCGAQYRFDPAEAAGDPGDDA